jgi:ATP-binding cassette subfamily B (MDR/TAP) protein 1
MPLMFLVLGNIVNNFTSYFIPGNNITKADFMHSVGTNALIIFGLFWARLIMSYISMYTIRISGLRISSNLRLAYIQALFRQPVGVIDQVSAGTISSRITSSANTIQTGISQQFYIFLQGIATLFGSYVVAFIRSWLLTFVASASLPFILLLYTFAIPFFVKYHREITRYNEQASALAYEILTSIRIVVAFCAEARLTKKHHEYLEKAHRVDRKLAPMMGFAFAPVMFAMYGTYALTFWFGIRQVKQGHVQNVGSIVTVLFSVMAGVMSLNQLLPPIIQISKVASAGKRLPLRRVNESDYQKLRIYLPRLRPILQT